MRRIRFYKGRINPITLPIIIFFLLLVVIFFLLFGALIFLVLGALGIGAAFLRLILGRSGKTKLNQKPNDDSLITLDKEDYKIVDVE